MTVEQVTYAAQCCPAAALRQLNPADLAALDRWCARALDDPDAEPQDGDEAAAVAKYEALLTSRRGSGGGYRRRPDGLVPRTSPQVKRGGHSGGW